jgi:endogenous inhibitor of DNA gyrase (YacG/DUF329 family)
VSHTNRHVARPPLGPDWFVQDVRSYSSWRDGVDDCATCGDDVDLRDDHFGMELFRPLPTAGKRGFERERRTFCSRHCVDVWLRG